jgi:glycosyltransferase involved in cell wall biosynthesis/spore maturation protein CgeB
MSCRWRVLLLEGKKSNPNHYLILAVEAALKAHPQVEYVAHARYDDALPVAIQGQCNLCFEFGGEQIDRGLCSRLNDVCGRSVVWFTEDPYCLPHNLTNASLFDIVITNDSASVPAYNRPTAYHLPLAACPGIHHHEVPQEDRDHYLYDLLFVGTAWPNRVAFLKQLLPRLPGIKTKIALPRNEHLPQLDLDRPLSSIFWRVPSSEFCRLANRSRIVLTLDRDYAADGTRARAASPGPRLFETALAGGFQLVDLSGADVSDYFTPGTEVGIFKSVDECRNQILHYLADPVDRLRMARSAQTRCRTEHLYLHRIKQLLALLDRHEADRKLPVQISSAPAERKRRILYVVHNVVRNPPFGGVEVYVDKLSQALPLAYEPFYYYPDQSQPGAKRLVFEQPRTGFRKDYRLSSSFNANALQDAERESCFAQVLHEHRIDLVHFQHLLDQPWSLPLVTRTMGIPAALTLADHYAVCAQFNLLNQDARYCNITALPDVTCDLCLSVTRNGAFGSQASRRSFISSVLQNIDLVIYPDASARDIAHRFYPGINESKVLVEGYPIGSEPGAPRSRDKRARLKAVVLGNFVFHKGGDTLCRVFAAMRDEEVDFHIYGEVLPPYQKRLGEINAPNVIIHGRYQPGSLRVELADADVALLLSIWPETYLITLSEVWKAGVVPIVTDIGAPGARVTDRMNGLKTPVHEPGSVVALIRELIRDRDELERLRQNIHTGLYREIHDHVSLLTQKYDELMDRYRVTHRSERFFSEAPVPRQATAANVFRTNSMWLIPHHSQPPTPGFVSTAARAARFLTRYGVWATIGRSAETLGMGRLFKWRKARRGSS